MIKTLILAFVSVSSSPVVLDGNPESGQSLEIVLPSDGEPVACCKVCTRGKACGDTCISLDDTCHILGGCACNG